MAARRRIDGPDAPPRPRPKPQYSCQAPDVGCWNKPVPGTVLCATHATEDMLIGHELGYAYGYLALDPETVDGRTRHLPYEARAAARRAHIDHIQRVVARLAAGFND